MPFLKRQEPFLHHLVSPQHPGTYLPGLAFNIIVYLEKEILVSCHLIAFFQGQLLCLLRKGGRIEFRVKDCRKNATGSSICSVTIRLMTWPSV